MQFNQPLNRKTYNQTSFPHGEASVLGQARVTSALFGRIAKGTSVLAGVATIVALGKFRAVGKGVAPVVVLTEAYGYGRRVDGVTVFADVSATASGGRIADVLGKAQVAVTGIVSARFGSLINGRTNGIIETTINADSYYTAQAQTLATLETTSHVIPRFFSGGSAKLDVIMSAEALGVNEKIANAAVTVHVDTAATVSVFFWRPRTMEGDS